MEDGNVIEHIRESCTRDNPKKKIVANAFLAAVSHPGHSAFRCMKVALVKYITADLGIPQHEYKINDLTPLIIGLFDDDEVPQFDEKDMRSREAAMFHCIKSRKDICGEDAPKELTERYAAIVKKPGGIPPADLSQMVEMLDRNDYVDEELASWIVDTGDISPLLGDDPTGFPRAPLVKDLGEWLNTFGITTTDYDAQYDTTLWNQPFIDIVDERYAKIMKDNNALSLLVEKRKSTYQRNLWPKEDICALPPAFGELKRLMEENNDLEKRIFHNHSDLAEHTVLANEGMFAQRMIDIFPDNLKVYMEMHNSYKRGMGMFDSYKKAKGE
ncbi:hypothetical protein SEMRO_1526_G279740.1 [Seminavis robusta]|uniref:Uncharacterized protein n=1 Tax=Seminavis robusta TaxID=568900 RepID=A0A9N8ENG5_9STRA|nr:hypothetical protein SEMRO_1526_G279740.1 [Seminavis robusta]|eukprot:Sro1526_g279740.1 n/a (328) ;mRNA; r:4718-5701